MNLINHPTAVLVGRQSLACWCWVCPVSSCWDCPVASRCWVCLVARWCWIWPSLPSCILRLSSASETQLCLCHFLSTLLLSFKHTFSLDRLASTRDALMWPCSTFFKSVAIRGPLWATYADLHGLLLHISGLDGLVTECVAGLSSAGGHGVVHRQEGCCSSKFHSNASNF